jgi:putative endonuclease
MNKGHRTGKRGEDIACQYLRQQGYEIIARNWRSRFGEIDIIARDGDSLVFVEVKTRTGSGFGGPEGALDERKRGRIIATAKAYLSGIESDLAIRFDLVALRGKEIELYKDAFREEEACSPGY